MSDCIKISTKVQINEILSEINCSNMSVLKSGMNAFMKNMTCSVWVKTRIFGSNSFLNIQNDI